MSMLPKTDNRYLQATIVLLCLAMSVYLVRVVAVGGMVGMAIAAFLILPLVTGLWLLKELARKLVSALLVFLVIVLPPGIINPFSAMDMQGAPPAAGELALRVYPWVAVGLLLAHVLGKYKSEFTPLLKNKAQGRQPEQS